VDRGLAFALAAKDVSADCSSGWAMRTLKVSDAQVRTRDDDERLIFIAYPWADTTGAISFTIFGDGNRGGGHTGRSFAPSGLST